MDPESFKKINTDRENPQGLASADRILTPDTFAKGQSARTASTSVSGSGGGISSGSISRAGGNGNTTGLTSVPTLTPGDRLGVLSGAFESGNDPTVVANNPNDPNGGPSYGEHQISTRQGTMREYLTYLRTANPSLYATLEAAGGNAGASAATPEFANAWRTSMSDPANAETQHDFLVDTHYGRLARKVQRDTGFDAGSRSRALQEVFFSVAIQHGGGTSLINRAIEATGSANPSDDALIRAIYTERRRRNIETGHPVYFTSTPRNDADNIVDIRFPRERDQALELLENETSFASSTPPPTLQSDGTLSNT